MGKNAVFLVLAVFVLISIVDVMALTVNSVDADNISPGQEGTIKIELENNLNDDVEDVSLNLIFTPITTGGANVGQEIPLTPVGTSEQSIEEIQSDDEETFVFRVRAASNARAGDYEIPFTIQYKIAGEQTARTRQGTIGIRIVANPDLSYSVNADTPVQGMKGTITLRIVNKGFYDARFVIVKVLENGYRLLSDDEVYIGTVNSDDFETATFDVLFNSKNPKFDAIVEYRDFDNEIIEENIDLPMIIYTPERAKELGIIKRSYVFVYIITFVLVIVLIIVWRWLRRRARMKRSQARMNMGGK